MKQVFTLKASVRIIDLHKWYKPWILQDGNSSFSYESLIANIFREQVFPLPLIPQTVPETTEVYLESK